MNTYQALMALAQRQPVQPFFLDIDPSQAPDTFRLVLGSEEDYTWKKLSDPSLQIDEYTHTNIHNVAIAAARGQVTEEYSSAFDMRLRLLLSVIVMNGTRVTLYFHHYPEYRFTAEIKTDLRPVTREEIWSSSTCPLLALTYCWREYIELLSMFL